MNAHGSEQRPRRQAHAPTAASSAAIQEIILAHIHDAVFATNLDNRVTFWGPSAERMFGYTAQAAIGRPLGELLPYRMAVQEDEGALFATLRAGRTWRGSGSARLPDGSEMWIESTVQPIMTDGRVIGSVSVSRDMTESKRTETALARVLDIIDFLPDATFVIDADRHVIAWNRAVEEMTGMSPAMLRVRTEVAAKMAVARRR